MRTRATDTIVPLGGSATMAEMRVVPDAMAMRTNPASIASPPAVVTRTAWSADALASDLNRYLLGEEVMARPLNGSERARRAYRKHRHTVGLFAMVASVLLIIIVAFLFTLFSLRSSNEQLGSAVGEAQDRREIAGGVEHLCTWLPDMFLCFVRGGAAELCKRLASGAAEL